MPTPIRRKPSPTKTVAATASKKIATKNVATKNAATKNAATKSGATKSGGLAAKAVFAHIQKHCLAKPGAVEDYPWGDVVWKVTGKLFAATGQDAAGVTVKASLEDQAVLVQHPAISIAKYVGRFGWVTIEIADEATLQLACKLIDDSYAALTAGTAKASRPPLLGDL